ncbi:unnamed protein product [Vicia faba]|uniref:Uncharacterized protein n=1 Tax=Vicia faba TaxID=3906 RepID=A0AAV1B9Q8_VICFA|nr:unnamed protein product [Vicia faba]
MIQSKSARTPSNKSYSPECLSVFPSPSPFVKLSEFFASSTVISVPVPHAGADNGGKPRLKQTPVPQKVFLGQQKYFGQQSDKQVFGTAKQQLNSNTVQENKKNYKANITWQRKMVQQMIQA